MAKQIIHVGLAISIDGMLPGVDNILGISAVVGKLGSFNQNVIPQDGVYKVSPFWAKHPEEFEELKRNPSSLRDTISQFRSWLEQWQGTLVACTGSLDFWHLMHAMLVTYKTSDKGSAFRFGPMPLDTNTWIAAQSGLKSPKKVTEFIRPLDVAMERWKIGSAGHIPEFGTKPRPKAKPTRQPTNQPVSFTVPTPQYIPSTEPPSHPPPRFFQENWDSYVSRITREARQR